MTKKVLERQYGLRINDQGQIYKTSVLCFVTRTLLHFDGGIFFTMLADGVLMTTKLCEYQYELGVKSRGHIYLKSVLWLVTRAPLSYFDKVYSYLAQ